MHDHVRKGFLRQSALECGEVCAGLWVSLGLLPANTKAASRADVNNLGGSVETDTFGLNTGRLTTKKTMANIATRSGVEGHRLAIHAPLIDLSKADIIRTGHALGVDYALTVSCYQADELGRACGVCDSCRLRAEGFAAAGIPDPTHYRI